MTTSSIANQSKPNPVFLRPALASDISKLETLLNRSYRFEGWTHETELVGGIRTNVAELTSIIEDNQQYLFVYPQTENGQETGEILGCINVAIEDNSAYIGLFAVNPDLQGSGVGSALLAEAEVFIQRYFCYNNTTFAQSAAESSANENSIKMLVLKGRDKMLAYYQRRGYVCTGNTQPFLENDSKGESNNGDLYFIEIKKALPLPS